jgi:integrase
VVVVRGHIVSRGPINPKTGKHAGAPWLVVVELGLQPAQRCAACVNPKGAHRLFWLKDRPLAACPVCGGELEDVKARKQFTHDGIATHREAEAELEEQLGERKAGTYVEPSDQTVAEFLTKRWLPDTQHIRKPSTHASYEHHVKAYLVPGIGTLLLRHLDAGHINAMYATLAAQDGGQRGKGLSPATRRRIHHTLRRALRDALKWKLVAYNAAASADPPAIDNDPPEMNYWSRDELRTFLDSVAEDRLFAMWRTFATTGMRRGEVLGLQWKRIDFEHARLQVQQARVVVGSKVVLSTPKTKKGRRPIPLNGGTMAALRKWRDTQADELLALGVAQGPETYLFTDKKGEPLNPELVTTMFNRHQLALDVPQIRLHDLRHTYATLGALEGIHPTVMAAILGHDVMTYLTTYAHVVQGMGESAMELVAARIDAD